MVETVKKVTKATATAKEIATIGRTFAFALSENVTRFVRLKCAENKIHSLTNTHTKSNNDTHCADTHTHTHTDIYTYRYLTALVAFTRWNYRA